MSAATYEESQLHVVMVVVVVVVAEVNLKNLEEPPGPHRGRRAWLPNVGVTQ